MSYIGFITASNCDGTGTVVSCGGRKERRIEGKHFVELALNDLKIVWKHASRLQIMKEQYEIYEIIPIFIDSMKMEKSVHVKDLKLCRFSLDDVHEILPIFDAELLESIEFWKPKQPVDRMSDQFERITHLDYWKNAKNCEIFYNDFDSQLLVHFFHFQYFKVGTLPNFPTRSAIQIRDVSELFNILKVSRLFCRIS